MMIRNKLRKSYKKYDKAERELGKNNKIEFMGLLLQSVWYLIQTVDILFSEILALQKQIKKGEIK